MKISVKLDRDTLRVILDGTRSFAEQKEEVEKHLLGMKSFLENGRVRFAYEGAFLSFEEEVELCEIADKAFGYEVDFCHLQPPPHSMTRHFYTNGEKLIKKVCGTVKQGEVVKSNGDMLVLGDVNAGAQIMARGDIYVIGNLRGVAHAGCSGDANAVVYAMHMNPVMIKIADKIGFNPSTTGENLNGFAQIINGEVKIKLV
ncbi:MAG: hypothetical protein IJ435_08545 [Clostridia bacterium]|nr:hypothetical protein [Clostridia bacterium]